MKQRESFDRGMTVRKWRCLPVVVKLSSLAPFSKGRDFIIVIELTVVAHLETFIFAIVISFASETRQ